VLVGRDNWSGLLTWLKDTVLARGNIGPAEFALLTLVDDPEEVVAVIRKAHDGQGLL
jgi:predicted Rossmann-fold nucleotide-binding protein